MPAISGSVMPADRQLATSPKQNKARADYRLPADLAFGYDANVQKGTPAKNALQADWTGS
jgi:hypothetical protein